MAVCASFPYGLLYQDETPEFAGHEVVYVTATIIVERFAADRRRALKRILANVHDSRHIGRDFLSGPTIWLLKELELEVIDAKAPRCGPPK